MGKLVSGLYKLMLVIAVTAGIVFGVIGCNNTNSIVVIEGPTHLLAEPDWEDAPGNKIIATLQKGEQGKIIHIRYSKSCMFYKIKLGDGRKGYVSHGDKFKVIETHK